MATRISSVMLPLLPPSIGTEQVLFAISFAWIEASYQGDWESPLFGFISRNFIVQVIMTPGY
jgi:hypothetical protein